MNGQIVPVLEASGVDVVLNGHDHNYQRFHSRGGITYIVTGGSGNKLYGLRSSARLAHAASVFHYVRGTADAHMLRLEAIGLDRSVFDSVTLTK